MDFKNHKAIYLQIADSICDSILRGEYTEGEKLPSVRDIAVQVEVNVNTVARTLEFLQQKDIVCTRRGLGNFVNNGAKSAIEEIRREEFFGETLPELFRTMESLNISIQDVVNKYQKSSNK